MKRVTLADIAKKCGVSVNTVSHALKDKPDISKKTTELIKKTAEKMGYIQNASASFLRSGFSKSIAIIVGDISNPHFSIMIKEMEQTAREEGYTCFVLNTDENEGLEKDAIVAAISKNVDGIVICPTQKSTKNIEFLEKSGIPFTLIGRRFENLETNYVVCDDENGGYLAAKYIAENGGKKTAIINGEISISSAKERLLGIEKYFAENNISLNKKDIYTVKIGNFDNSEILQKIASKGYDSIICFSDVIALEFLCFAEKEVKIVSFDHIRSKFAIPVTLQSITSSKTKMSNIAMEIIIKAIKGETEIKKVILPTKLS